MLRSLALSLALLASCAPAFATQSAEQGKKKELGKLSGTITLDGKPAPYVTLMLVETASAPSGSAPAATSDASGHYTFADVPTGQYRVVTGPSAYVIDGATGDFRGVGKEITVGEGDVIDDMNLSIRPGGVITGRVVSQDGTPVIGELVELTRVEDHRSESVDGMFQPALRTDDRGVYRIFGLAPGAYFVSLGRRPGASSPYGSKYERTYYPSVSDESRAKLVEVAAGEVAKDIDITVSDARKGFSIAGVAHIAGSDTPVVQATIMVATLVDGHVQSYGSYGSFTDATGSFRLSGLTTGSYKLVFDTRSKLNSYCEPVDVEVTDHDITDLDVPFQKGATVTGVAEYDDAEQSSARAPLSTVTLHLQRNRDGAGLDDVIGSQFLHSEIQDDGSFSFVGLKPASYRIYCGYGRQVDAGAFYVWEIDVDGAPVKDLVVPEGEGLSNVRVRLKYGDGTVRGVVKTTGEAPPGLQLSIGARRSDTEDFFNEAQIDERRQFVMNRMPAGTFTLVLSAWAEGPNASTNFQPKPVSVTIRSGETTTVEIPLDFVRDAVKPE